MKIPTKIVAKLEEKIEEFIEENCDDISETTPGAYYYYDSIVADMALVAILLLESTFNGQIFKEQQE